MSGSTADSLTPAALAAGTWSLVAASSTASFRVRDKLVATVTGSFPVLSGSVAVGADGTAHDVRVELDAAGVETGNARRDKDLRTARFLAVEEHPVLVVEAGRAPAGPSGWQLAAELTARGRRCPVTLDVVPVGRDGTRVRAQVTGRLDRSGLGIRVPSFIVGRFVDLEVAAVFEQVP